MTHHHGKVRPVDPLQLLYCALPQKETCGGVCPHVVGRATFRRLKCCVPGGFPCHGDHHKWPRPDDHNKPRPDNHHKWPRPDDHSKWPRPDDDSKWPRPDGDYKPRPDDHHKWPRPDDHNKPRPDAHKHHSDGERHGDRRRRRLSMFMEQRTEENHPHHHHFAPPPCHKCFHHHHHHRNRSHDGDRPRPQELTLIASALQEPLPSTTARMEEPRMPRHHVHGKHHHRRSQDNVQFIMQEFVKLFTLFAIGGFFGRYFTLRKLQQQQQEQVADVTEPLIKA